MNISLYVFGPFHTSAQLIPSILYSAHHIDQFLSKGWKPAYHCMVCLSKTMDNSPTSLCSSREDSSPERHFLRCAPVTSACPIINLLLSLLSYGQVSLYCIKTTLHHLANPCWSLAFMIAALKMFFSWGGIF